MARGCMSNRRCARPHEEAGRYKTCRAAFMRRLVMAPDLVLDILWAVLAGTGIGLSLAAPPGPVNAIIASQTVTRSWRAGFLVGMGATTADTIFLAVSIVAHSVVASMQGWVPIIALLGAGVMAYFAWNTVRDRKSTRLNSSHVAIS